MTNIEKYVNKKLVVELYCLHHVRVQVTGARTFVY